jgi:hypothetical protein
LVVDGDSDSVPKGDEEDEPSCAGYCLAVSDIKVDETGDRRLDLLVCQRRWTWAGGHLSRVGLETRGRAILDHMRHKYAFS